MLAISKLLPYGGRLFTWGANPESLGYKISSSTFIPRQVQLPQKVVKAQMGTNHSAVITQSGRLFTFGNNVNGCLGHNIGQKGSIQPKQIQFFKNNKLQVVDVICGQKHTIALTHDGDVWSWGYAGRDINALLSIFVSSVGSLGHGSNKHCFAPTPIDFFRKKQKIIQISGGLLFANALNEKGEVYNWGRGEYGVFGDGNNRSLAIPRLNDYIEYLKSQQGGSLTFNNYKSCNNFTLCTGSNKKMYGWGSNQYGQIGVKSQLGVQIIQTVNFMIQIEDQYEGNIINYEAGQDSIIYMKDNGIVCWSGMKLAYKPQKFQLPTNIVAKHIGAAYRTVVVVDDQNHIYMKNKFVNFKEQDKKTGIKKAYGDQLFNGKILKVGGKYKNLFAIVQ